MGCAPALKARHTRLAADGCKTPPAAAPLLVPTSLGGWVAAPSCVSCCVLLPAPWLSSAAAGGKVQELPSDSTTCMCGNVGAYRVQGVVASAIEGKLRGTAG
jgi:hypothetical protein